MRKISKKFTAPTLASILIVFFLVNACAKKNRLAWDQNFPNIGSQSSPRAADLNDDGILDIVIGAGKNEFNYSETGVLALNGRDGEILWQQDAQDQVFGSATFLDITGDGIPDVFIGGRSPNFRALDGRNGNVLWAYTLANKDDPILTYARCNFFNSQVIPDQDGDDIKDLLIVNGGSPIIAPYVEEGRLPGVLMIFSAIDGKVIAADTMPDGQESYMSPIIFQQPGADDLTIIFGSGGETLNGNLYMTTLTDLRNQNLADAKIIAADTGHGFVAPPVAADINNDGFYDVVAISHGSNIFAIDGKDQSIIWKQKIEGT
ncbi:MAG: PQQ-binding-like beta-propeller repeat protein [Bacteroidetes bacterium]|nr:PQQ-binding-like beta-propeller repeat protein [Bacteroidota bacterium]MDA1120785.1 PQQ-binding-like beta-propeller repeat protein [Bacteroidota bacterium]